MADLYSQPQAIAFLRDIIEHPDDDTPRLVFPDWLDDHGDEARAEFIRAQIDREKLPAYTLRHRQILAREEDLLEQHGAAWQGRLADITRDVTFRRGFVEDIRLGVRQFMDHAEELFSLTPIRKAQLLRVNQSKLSMEAIATSPHVRRLRGISLSGSELGEEPLAAFLGALESDALEELDLARSGLVRQGLTALASARLPRLRKLSLAGNSIGYHLRGFTIDSPPFNLRELDLSGAYLSQEFIHPLWDWSGLASLEALDVSYIRIGMRGAQAMTASPHLGAMKRLHLSNCNIGQGGARALACCGKLSKLEGLDLRGNALKVPGLEALLASPLLTRIAELDLTDNELGQDGVARMSRWPHLPGVRVLGLRNNNVTGAGVRAILDATAGELVELSLSDNRIGVEGVMALAQSPRLARLTSLYVARVSLRDEEFSPLVESPSLGELRHLDVCGNYISAAFLLRLRKRFRHVGF